MDITKIILFKKSVQVFLCHALGQEVVLKHIYYPCLVHATRQCFNVD